MNTLITLRELHGCGALMFFRLSNTFSLVSQCFEVVYHSRAGVLGANDGLVSVASLMLGVGGGTDSLHAMTLAGVAGLVAGALSMACGEFISVSSQRSVKFRVKKGLPVCRHSGLEWGIPSFREQCI